MRATSRPADQALPPAAAGASPRGRDHSPIPWPLAPNEQHEVGNTYGEFQNYGGSPYPHPGVDVMGADLSPVYAVNGGPEQTLAAVLVVTIALVSFYTARLAQERDRARRGEAKAEQVAAFLTDMFSLASPDQSRGADITAREILTRGADKVMYAGYFPMGLSLPKYLRAADSVNTTELGWLSTFSGFPEINPKLKNDNYHFNDNNCNSLLCRTREHPIKVPES